MLTTTAIRAPKRRWHSISTVSIDLQSNHNSGGPSGSCPNAWPKRIICSIPPTATPRLQQTMAICFQVFFQDEHSSKSGRSPKIPFLHIVADCLEGSCAPKAIKIWPNVVTLWHTNSTSNSSALNMHAPIHWRATTG